MNKPLPNPTFSEQELREEEAYLELEQQKRELLGKTDYSPETIKILVYILREIEKVRELSVNNKIDLIKYIEDREQKKRSHFLFGFKLNDVTDIDREHALQKLESFEAIDNLHTTKRDSKLYWTFTIGYHFFGVQLYFEDLYSKSTVNKVVVDNTPGQIIDPPDSTKNQILGTNDILYRIVYTSKREILLDGKYLLSKPNFKSENEVVFTYVFNNSGKTITLKEIEANTRIKLTKSLPVIMDKLGFKKDIKKLFLDVSKSSIFFKKEITREDFEQTKMERVRL